MYCYRCGQRLADGSRHCPNCGAAIFYDENGPLDKRPTDNCDECANESFGAAYSMHDASKTQTEQDPYGGYSQQHYQNPYQNTYQQGGYGNAGRNGQQPYNYNYSYTPPVRTRQDGYALTGLIFAIASAVMCCVPYMGFPLALAGLLFAILGMKSTARRSMAVTALVLSILFLIGNGFILAIRIYYAAHPEVLEEFMKQFESMMGTIPGGAESQFFIQ